VKAEVYGLLVFCATTKAVIYRLFIRYYSST